MKGDDIIVIGDAKVDEHLLLRKQIFREISGQEMDKTREPKRTPKRVEISYFSIFLWGILLLVGLFLGGQFFCSTQQPVPKPKKGKAAPTPVPTAKPQKKRKREASSSSDEENLGEVIEDADIFKDVAKAKTKSSMNTTMDSFANNPALIRSITKLMTNIQSSRQKDSTEEVLKNPELEKPTAQSPAEAAIPQSRLPNEDDARIEIARKAAQVVFETSGTTKNGAPWKDVVRETLFSNGMFRYSCVRYINHVEMWCLSSTVSRKLTRTEAKEFRVACSLQRKKLSCN